jgi:hypothetical protein
MHGWIVLRRVRVCRLFKECPHPDEKQRGELSKRLGLDPRQVKFWFQNRRTQMKVNGRTDSSLSRHPPIVPFLFPDFSQMVPDMVYISSVR